MWCLGQQCLWDMLILVCLTEVSDLFRPYVSLNFICLNEMHLFREMSERNLVSWSVLITGYVQMGYFLVVSFNNE